MTDRIRVAIVDDHPLVRQGLGSILETFADIEVIGTAGSGEQAVIVCCQLNPDVILMDVNMEDMDGIEAMQRIFARCNHIKVLMLSSFDTDSRVQDALEAGAIGYMLKSAEVNELADAIRAANQGKRTLSPAALEALIRTRRTRIIPYGDLTQRETEVLTLLVEGKTNRTIADNLSISVSTVKFHTGTIYRKLEVKSRAEAVAKAVNEGIIRLP